MNLLNWLKTTALCYCCSLPCPFLPLVLLSLRHNNTVCTLHYWFLSCCRYLHFYKTAGLNSCLLLPGLFVAALLSVTLLGSCFYLWDLQVSFSWLDADDPVCNCPAFASLTLGYKYKALVKCLPFHVLLTLSSCFSLCSVVARLMTENWLKAYTGL